MNVALFHILMLNGWLTQPLLAMLLQERSSLLHKKQETLGEWKWAITVMLTLWELEIFVLRLTLDTPWNWRMCNMCFNLISTHILDKEGYGNYSGDGKWRLSKGSLVLIGGKNCCTLYKTQVKVCKDVVSATQEESTPNLWYRPLAHMSEKGL